MNHGRRELSQVGESFPSQRFISPDLGCSFLPSIERHSCKIRAKNKHQYTQTDTIEVVIQAEVCLISTKTFQSRHVHGMGVVM
jgi:hypothetical protein